jgi:hypothetical protein
MTLPLGIPVPSFLRLRSRIRTRLPLRVPSFLPLPLFLAPPLARARLPAPRPHHPLALARAPRAAFLPARISFSLPLPLSSHLPLPIPAALPLAQPLTRAHLPAPPLPHSRGPAPDDPLRVRARCAEDQNKPELARITHRLICRAPLRAPSAPSHALASSTDRPRLACGGRHAIWRRIRPGIGARHPALVNSAG